MEKLKAWWESLPTYKWWVAVVVAVVVVLVMMK
jgi:hypothetical protein